MGVLEVIIISLIVIFFVTLTGLSGISRAVTWVIAWIERTIFNNIIDDDGEKEEQNKR